MPRLAEGKRIRSIQFGADLSITSGVTYDQVAATHVFQDDVTIVGAEIMLEFLISDALSNTDGTVNGIAELSRQGQRAQPGTIGWCVIHTTWNGVICIGGETRKSEVIMFPDGMGVEVDEGEGVNALGFLTYTGTGSCPAYINIIVYYVER